LQRGIILLYKDKKREIVYKIESHTENREVKQIIT